VRPQRFATLHFGAAPLPPVGMLLSTTKVTVSVMRVDDSALPAKRAVIASEKRGSTSVSTWLMRVGDPGQPPTARPLLYSVGAADRNVRWTNDGIDQPAGLTKELHVVSDYSADRWWWRAAIALRRTVVVAEKAADALTPPNGAGAMLVSDTVNQVVAETLMIAFAMIVDQELGERTAEMPLTLRNEAVDCEFQIDLQTRLKELACYDSSRIRIRIRLHSKHGAHYAVDTTCGSEAARTDPSHTRHAAIGV
jgi:hypothetical protein